MSEPHNLVPNLNEIIEEYVEIEEEAIQEVQSRVVHEEKTRTETEQEAKETRKRKRGAEEVEIEQRKQM